jgi:hypothetical protein
MKPFPQDLAFQGKIANLKDFVSKPFFLLIDFRLIFFKAPMILRNPVFL